MAELTVTITESSTALAGGESTSDTVTKTISGVTGIYQFKGLTESGYGGSHCIYHNDGSYNIGNGSGYSELVYLRITNLEAASDEWKLKIIDATDDIIYTNLAVNESFIFFLPSGTTLQESYHIDSQSTGGAGVSIIANSNIKSIEVYNNDFHNKYYEIYAAFISGNL